MQNNNSVIDKAKELVEKYDKQAIDVAKRRVESLNGSYSRETDFAFLVLNEVEKLLDKNLD